MATTGIADGLDLHGHQAARTCRAGEMNNDRTIMLQAGIHALLRVGSDAGDRFAQDCAGCGCP